MDPQTKAFFNMEARGENAKCFDCGQKEPQWASLSNGIYICLECSGKHRSIGCHLSFVRCVWMDKWKPEQLAMMKAGGNQRLAEYLDEHGPAEWRKMPITSKYDIPACHNYRKLLKGWSQTGNWAASPAPAPAPQKAPAPAAPKPSAFSLFDVMEDADNLVNSLVSPKPSTEPQKPSKIVSTTASEAQRILNSMMKQDAGYAAPQAPPAPVVQAPVKQLPAAELKPAQPPAAKVNIWGDDFWDEEVEFDEI